ncbi:class I SAM-dependent methyltransferase [Crocosphaera sp. UHCC 0190]|uniref:class I SAM-dependent methyltransferase n=1 Tax=Crocosphaera sp. UHCC 0190 TaxID=3110246 RepID=UPI002B1F4527|nr:class I SAM-dependent methyltransferase [Crocosphaera sp. UHCC 0190]MEA5508725.1 class I SAM-dependent methyltransferase [Crocosphaera sp. UHCC 0190]
MGFYSNFIFPWGIEWMMSQSPFPEYRQELLKDVSGDVLEIGFGTGLNLAYYPETVKKLTVIDPNSGMNRFAKKRLETSQIPVESKVLGGENLPMDSESFDTVVSTWTLCSIPNVDQALSEIYRVLKPGGKFYFIEHGLSRDPNIQVWQNRLTPLQKVMADGCHLNRDIKQLVETYFNQVIVEEFYCLDFPKLSGYMYRGVATK